MKIEAGKFYKTRDGRKVGPMEVWPQGGWHADRAERPLNGGVWLDDGTSKHVGAKDSPTLISEWPSTPPHQKRTAEMIKVMQAYVDGENVEVRHLLESEYRRSLEGLPRWNWIQFDYRIAPAATPDTIDWTHVAPEFKWVARNINGTAYLHEAEPRLIPNSRWTSPNFARVTQASYLRGTCDWKDSLVKRP